MSEYHTPVLLTEAIDGLKVEAGKKYIDATVGGGGYSAEIVRRGGILLGIDTDTDALTEATSALTSITSSPTHWQLVHGNFRDIALIARERDFSSVDGIVFDLGVSSHQLDTPGRGFSFRFGDNAFDLRLNQGTGQPASELINSLTEEDIHEIIGKLGEEQHARAIARALVRARQINKIKTTGQVFDAIGTVVKGLKAKETAARVFQAFRMIVNSEGEALKEGLEGAKSLLVPGGRLAIVSFHSLEDRVVKQFMRSKEFALITKKPVIAGDEELELNSRSRSGKLRIAEKI